MSSNYPDDLDTFVDPTPADSMQTLSHAAQHALVNDAVAAMQIELGLNPRSGEPDVAARIGAVDARAIASATAVASQVDQIANELHQAVTGFYQPGEVVTTGEHRSYGGYDFEAAGDTHGQPPLPLGDATTADKAVLLAGRCGFARNVTGGDDKPTFTVSIEATSGAGSIGQAIADAKDSGGGYIVWDPMGGAGGTGVYTHNWPHGTSLFVPSNTTLNAAAADVTFTGFGYDDNTAFSIGGLTGDDFDVEYSSVPAHNIIIHGIKFDSNDGHADSHGDVFAVRYWATDIWVDHCYFTNAEKLSDGLCDAVHTNKITYSWCEFFEHHKAILNHSKTIVASPTGSDLPPGVTAEAPGDYIVETVNSEVHTATRVSYVHCLFNRLAQRGPMASTSAYVHVAGCWSRMFGVYNDGVNPAFNGLHNWPVYEGTRFAETPIAGPSFGQSGTGTEVPGVYHFNSGAGARIIDKGHMKVEGSVYTQPDGTTGTVGVNEDGSGNHLSQSLNGNVYTNCTAAADVDPENAVNPPYTLSLVPVAQVPDALQYGVGPQNMNTTPWTVTGASLAGSAVGVDQDDTPIGGARTINFTGSAIGTITYDSDTRTVSVPIEAGAVDPTTILLRGTHAARPAASTPNIGNYYYETDTTVLFQCTNATTWSAITGPITPLPVAGNELANVVYDPSSAQTNGTTTSTTLVDLASLAATASWTGNSASMFDLTFDVPDSGAVWVEMQMRIGTTTSNDFSYALYDVDLAAVVTNTTIAMSNTSSKTVPLYRKYISGLTPGDTLTYRWQVKVGSGATGTIYGAGGAQGAATMRVIAAT